MDFTFNFLHQFFIALYLISPLLAFLSTFLICLGMVVGHIEKWNKSDTLYWTFITATTVGYGDFRPEKPSSRALAVFIAIIGIMLTGIIVAITIHTATLAFKQQLLP